MFYKFAFLIACTALFACANAQSPNDGSDATAMIEIADGRESVSGEDYSNWVDRPAVQEAMTAARAYWHSQDSGYEEEARVMGVAEGSFTEAGATQEAILYVMSLWPRCCPKMGLAIMEGDRLIYNGAFSAIAQTLASVPDLDGDRLDEMVTTGFFGMGGQESGSMTLLHFDGSALSDLGTTSIFDGACAAGQDGSTAARITAKSGPVITIERFVQPSCEDQSWEPVGEPEALGLQPPSESPYTTLSVR